MHGKMKISLPCHWTKTKQMQLPTKTNPVEQTPHFGSSCSWPRWVDPVSQTSILGALLTIIMTMLSNCLTSQHWTWHHFDSDDPDEDGLYKRLISWWWSSFPAFISELNKSYLRVLSPHRPYQELTIKVMMAKSLWKWWWWKMWWGGDCNDDDGDYGHAMLVVMIV